MPYRVQKNQILRRQELPRIPSTGAIWDNFWGYLGQNWGYLGQKNKFIACM